MFERFTRDARATVGRAADVARRLGAEQVEPEHLLLALAGGDGTAIAAQALVEAGLDVEAIEHAIEQDLIAALEAVGVPPSVVASMPVHARADQPGFGVALKQALEQALRAAVDRSDRRIGSEHLLLGILQPPSPGMQRVLRALDVAPRRLGDLVAVELAARR